MVVTRLLQHIQQKHLFTAADKLLVAVSGGADSVFLSHVLAVNGYSITLAHCNFSLRGEESNRDEAFVRQLAQQLQVPLYSVRFDTAAYATEHQLSIQEAARELRYNWFNRLLNDLQLKYIVTAHHAGDNVETVLLNLFRGTGIKGLTGIPVKRGKIIRPLLQVSRNEIEAYLAEHRLSYVTDSSNLKNDYTRNYIRNVMLPQAGKLFTNAPGNILTGIQHINSAYNIYQLQINSWISKLGHKKNEEWHIPILKLRRIPEYATVLYEIIAPLGFTAHQLNEVLQLTESHTGSQVCSNTHRILKNRQWLVIAPLRTEKPSLVAITETGRWGYPEGILSVKKIKIKDVAALPVSGNAIAVNGKALVFPLVLRPWKAGDYFYPAGFNKKKKLSRYFIDEKLSVFEKEKIWVLESNQRIVWVCGMRMDNRFIPSKNDEENIMQLKITPAE